MICDTVWGGAEGNRILWILVVKVMAGSNPGLNRENWVMWILKEAIPKEEMRYSLEGEEMRGDFDATWGGGKRFMHHARVRILHFGASNQIMSRMRDGGVNSRFAN